MGFLDDARTAAQRPSTAELAPPRKKVRRGEGSGRRPANTKDKTEVWQHERGRPVSRYEMGSLLAARRATARANRREQKSKDQKRLLNELKHQSIRVGGINARINKTTKQVEIQHDTKQRKLFTTSAMLDMSHMQGVDKVKSVARTFRCGSGSVCKLRHAVAFVWLLKQSRLLKSMQRISALNRPARSSTYAVISRRWDETRRQVSVAMSKKLTRKQEVTAMNMLVSRRCYAVGRIHDPSNPLDESPLALADCVEEIAGEYQANCPILPLVANSAGCLDEGLMRNDFVADFVNFEVAAPDNFDDVVVLLGKDQATGNEKLVAKWQGDMANEFGELPDHVTMIVGTCGLHRNSLIEGAVMGCAGSGLQFMNRLFTSSVWLCSGQHFLLMTTALEGDRVFNAGTVKLVRSEPPPEDRLLQELIKYQVTHHNRFKTGVGVDAENPDAVPVGSQAARNVDDDVAHEQRGDVNTYKKLWEEYASIVNGGFEDGVFTHHCPGRHCCSSWIDTAAKLRDNTRKLQMLSAPRPPPANKWTKLGPTVDKYIAMHFSNGLLKLCADEAFDATWRDRENIAVDYGDVDVALLQDLVHSQIKGVRLRRFREFVSNDRTVLVIVALAIEPVRYLTEIYLQGTCEQVNRCDPVVFKFTDPLTSPARVTLHYCRMLLRGEGTRLIFLYGPYGFETLADWANAFPQDAKTFRDSMLLASAWIHDRHKVYYDSEPICLAMLGDPRKTRDKREDLVKRFKYLAPRDEDGDVERPRSECCVPWCARPLFRKSVEELLGPKFACLTFRWAGMFIDTVADIECRHARNSVDSSENIENLGAGYVNKEAMACARICLRRRVAAAVGRTRAAASEDSGDGEDDDDNSCGDGPNALEEAPGNGEGADNVDGLAASLRWMLTTTQALGKKEVLRRELAAELQESGDHETPKDFARMHALTASKWEGLSGEEQAHYEWLAELSKDIAKANKQAAAAAKSSAVGGEAGARGSAEHAPPPAPHIWDADTIHSQPDLPDVPSALLGAMMSAPAEPPLRDFVDILSCERGAPMQLDEVERRPLSVEALENELGDRPSLATTEFHEQFFRRYQQVISDRGSCDRVTYYDNLHCGSICKDPNRHSRSGHLACSK